VKTLSDVAASMQGLIAQSPRDWSVNSYDAWIYGIFSGWGPEAMEEVAARHRWTPEMCERLRQLHVAWLESLPWRWPLFEGPAGLPDLAGRFGAVRKYDVHTGVDLYTYPGMPVLAVESGEVVAIEDFTGPKAGSPWWNDTQAVLVEGASGVVCYGEIVPPKEMRVGDRLEREQYVGGVRTVLKKDKGRPTTMLHVELYEHGTRETVWWRHGEPRPHNLLDPTEHLIASLQHLRHFSEGRA